MARHSVEKTSGILSDMVCPQEIAKHVNARKLHWYRSPPVFTQNSQCPKVGPTASSPKIVCEAACEMTGTAGTDTTGTTLPNHPRTSDSVWICWVELSEIATGLLLPYSSKFSSRVYSKMFEDVCLFYMKTQSWASTAKCLNWCIQTPYPDWGLNLLPLWGYGAAWEPQEKHGYCSYKDLMADVNLPQSSEVGT